jgi:hypothetical protein
MPELDAEVLLLELQDALQADLDAVQELGVVLYSLQHVVCLLRALTTIPHQVFTAVQDQPRIADVA